MQFSCISDHYSLQSYSTCVHCIFGIPGVTQRQSSSLTSLPWTSCSSMRVSQPCNRNCCSCDLNVFHPCAHSRSYCSNSVPASGALTYTANAVTFLGLQHILPSAQTALERLRSTLARLDRSPGQVKQQGLQIDLLQSPISSVVECAAPPSRILPLLRSSALRIQTEGVHITPETPEQNSTYVSFLVLLQQPFSRGSTVSTC